MSEQKKNNPQRGRIDHSGEYRRDRTGSKSRSREKDGKKVSSAIIRLLIVLLAVLVIVTVWRNRIDLTCANLTQCADDSIAMMGTGAGFPSTINGSRAASVHSIAGSGIALLSDTALTIYDDTAREAAVRSHFMSDPAMKTSGRYAAVINIGATDYRVEAAAETIATGDAERPLISCAVSRNCCYALVMQGSSRGESWLSSVEVFNRSGKSLHKWHCANWYITDAALSADGKYLAMCGVNAKDGDFVGAIIIQKVGSDEQIAEYVLSNNIYFSLEYNNEGVLFAVGSQAVTIVTDNGTSSQNITHNGELVTFDICYDGGAVVCTEDELNCLVTVYDTYGRERFSRNVDIDVQNAALSDEACAVLGSGKLELLRLDGTEIARTDANASVGGLLLIDRTAYVVDGMRISSWEG